MAAVAIPLAASHADDPQSKELAWSDPYNLSESETSSADPAIVADQFARIHVFWSEDRGGEPHPQDKAPQAGNSIIYRQLTPGGVWTEPLAIAYVGPNARVENPNALVDSDGKVHLTWIESGSLVYSSSHAFEASDPKAWSIPITITGPKVSDSRLIDQEEGILIVFTVASGPLPGVHAVGVADGVIGKMRPVWLALGESGKAAQFLSVASDTSGRIHVVWEVNTPPSPTVEEVRYARSLDGGESWPNARVVAQETDIESRVRFARPWVAVRNGDEVHLEWAQGRLPYRWHQVSSDGGNTWGDPYQIWPNLVSNTNSQAVGVDAANTLHWVDVLRYPNGAYAMEWQEGGWTLPELFYLMQQSSRDPLGERINTHRFRMAISLGNRLHIVFQDQNRAEVYHMMAALDIEGFPAEPVQTPAVEIANQARTTATLEATVQTNGPTAVPAERVISPGSQGDSMLGFPVLIGIASSFVFVGLAILASRLRD